MWQLLCRNPGQRASLEMREVFLELGAVAFQPVSGRKAFCGLDSYLRPSPAIFCIAALSQQTTFLPVRT